MALTIDGSDPRRNGRERDESSEKSLGDFGRSIIRIENRWIDGQLFLLNLSSCCIPLTGRIVFTDFRSNEEWRKTKKEQKKSRFTKLRWWFPKDDRFDWRSDLEPSSSQKHIRWHIWLGYELINQSLFCRLHRQVADEFVRTNRYEGLADWSYCNYPRRPYLVACTPSNLFRSV